MTSILLGLLIGAAAGLLGALLGVGGGILMVPFFVLVLKMEPKSAIATSMAVIVVTAISATMNNSLSKTPLIDWRIALTAGAAAMVAAWFGADLMKTLSNPTLTRIFGGVLVVVGIKALLMK